MNKLKNLIRSIRLDKIDNSLFDQIMHEKVRLALDIKKVAIAQKAYNQGK